MPAMTGPFTLRGPTGGMIIIALVVSVIATLVLVLAAVRRDPGGRLGRRSGVALAAAMLCNGIGRIWPVLSLLRWAVLPLQGLAIVGACIVVTRRRPVSATAGASHVTDLGCR